LDLSKDKLLSGIPFTLHTRDESPNISNLCGEFVNHLIALALFSIKTKASFEGILLLINNESV